MFRSFVLASVSVTRRTKSLPSVLSGGGILVVSEPNSLSLVRLEMNFSEVHVSTSVLPRSPPQALHMGPVRQLSSLRREG